MCLLFYGINCVASLLLKTVLYVTLLHFSPFYNYLNMTFAYAIKIYLGLRARRLVRHLKPKPLINDTQMN